MTLFSLVKTPKHAVLALLAALLFAFSPALFADYEDGINAAFEGNYATAFREFSLAAEEGLDLAQFNLAILYFTGRGVEKDEALAFKWTLAAAEQGHTDAQFNLASLYSEGDGTKKDMDKAVEWFTYAARAGHPLSAFILASMYKDGDHVSRDAVQAHAWASLAISNENADAIGLREELEDDMSPTQLSQARRLFARWQLE
ncbi:MAG: sel1 repeat family protein [Pseudohongiella sp.]|nr:sel1 repeat family protein [Pseudohongiella sp.]